jgi:UDP-3-O-[3-hydroxymyristoyl] glucosamine N-acyltransferase
MQPTEPQNADTQPANPDATAPRSESTGHQLASHMNSLKARDLSFAQAATLGVELVHHPDSTDHQIFHTADGDIIYFNETIAEWDVVDHGRVGQAIKSGNMDRIHIAYIAKDAVIDDTAVIAETATVEPGARIGPYAKVGEHAHVGAGAIVSSYVRVEDGAFIGAFSSVRDGSRVGPGAVLGAGSLVGASTNIGAGARLEQRTEIGAFDNVSANSRVGGSSTKDRSTGSKLHPQQISHLVDKLAALDRD